MSDPTHILARWGAYMRRNGIDLGYPHVSPLHRDWSPGESQEVLEVDPELERVCTIVYAQPKRYRDILHWRFRDRLSVWDIGRRYFDGDKAKASKLIREAMSSVGRELGGADADD